MMEPVYYGMSWLLLRLQHLWDALLPDGRFLGTDWDWVLAIVGVAVVVRLMLFPLFLSQIGLRRKLLQIEPRLAQLRMQHRDDPQTLRLEIVKLYQEARVNPLRGCLPILIEIPVLIGLVHVLRSRDPRGFEPYTAIPKTLYGWTVEQFDSAATARLVTAPITASFLTGPVATRIVAGLLVVLMGLTTFTLLKQTSPERGAVRYVVPVIVVVNGPWLPIGLSVYWVSRVLLSMAQQAWLERLARRPVTT